MSVPARPRTLAEWLGYLETLHPKSIAMGLDRVRAVHARMGLPLQAPVITVTGTNGKGSTSAMLESILRAAGYRTALYTSPHLLRYNERVAVGGVPVDDAAIVEAFHEVEDARAALDPPVPLTYFEFGTLAALATFARAAPEAIVLEVGLGGRLDAVNVVDADVSVVTSVDLDHMDYLGPTREHIGREKAGIMRPGRPAVCGDPDPPEALVAYARGIGAPLHVAGRDFRAVAQGKQWRYEGPGGPRFGLPFPALRGAFQLRNAASALAALGLLRPRLPVSAAAVREGLLRVELPGRFTVLPGRPVTVLDVAHNPQAARTLADTLGEMGFHPRTIAVAGVLRDKDVAGIVRALAPRVDEWRIASLPGPRGGGTQAMRAALQDAGVAERAIRAFDDVESAWRDARASAGEADRIVVFGSFLTVASVLGDLSRERATRSSA